MVYTKLIPDIAGHYAKARGHNTTLDIIQLVFAQSHEQERKMYVYTMQLFDVYPRLTALRLIAHQQSVLGNCPHCQLFILRSDGMLTSR